MTRSLRLAHRAAWIVLAFALALGLSVALEFRLPALAAAKTTTEEPHK